MLTKLGITEPFTYLKSYVTSGINTLTIMQKQSETPISADNSNTAEPAGIPGVP
jgi:hypothetical protein